MHQKSSAGHSTASRMAILAGINSYWLEPSSLQYAESDCQRLAEAICQSRFGFGPENTQVMVASDSDPRNRPFRANLLYRMFESARRRPTDLFLFYFAGHGIEVDGRTYLVPTDGLVSQTDTCVPLQALLEQIGRLPARHRLLIFDICHGGGVRGPSAGLPGSFSKEVEPMTQAIVLSACNINEKAHEDRSLQAGVYTHFWCEALNGGVSPTTDGQITVSAVHDYAWWKVQQWAKQNNCQQTPVTFASSCPAICLCPVDLAKPSPPPFVMDKSTRTDKIIAVFRHILGRRDVAVRGKLIVRIHARLSAFAIPDDEPQKTADPGYYNRLTQERQLLEELFDQGAQFRVILSWNLDDYLRLGELGDMTVDRRLPQLLRFLKTVANDDQRYSRFTIVNLPVYDRNILILGDEYHFEGRKLDIKGGFDATNISTDEEFIGHEIALFDKLFDNGIRFVCERADLPTGASKNKRLLEHLICQLERDLAQLIKKV